MADTSTGTGSPGQRPRMRVTPIEKDSDTNRNWIIRWIELGGWLLLLIGGGALLGAYLVTWPLRILFPTSAAWAPFVFGWVGAFAGGLGFATLFGSRLTKIVPRNQALVTTNLLTDFVGAEEEGAMVPYGPGLHISSAFEDTSEEGNISTKILTLDFLEDIPTQSSALKALGFILFRASMRRVQRFAQIDEPTLKQGLVGKVTGRLQSMLSGKKAEDQLPEIEQISGVLTNDFGITTPGGDARMPGVDPPTDVEEELGIDIIAVGLAGLDLPEAVQKTRDAGAQLELVKQQIAIIAGFKNHDDLLAALGNNIITRRQYQQYLQLALIASKSAEGKINIHDVSGDRSILGAGAVLGSAINPQDGGQQP